MTVNMAEPRLRSLFTFLAVLQALLLAFFIAGTHGWIVPLKKPVTTDFASFYAAGRLALQGQSEHAYDPPGGEAGAPHSLHWRAEESATEPGIDYQFFFNPPPFQLLAAPQSLLPYLGAFLLLQALTLPLWLALGTRAAGGGATAAIGLLAVPAVWWALGEGQTSSLSAALLAGGTLLLPARPLLAGFCFGALAYKPHLALLVPLALLAAAQWRAIAGAALMLGAQIAASTLLFGPASWVAFLGNARRTLGMGGTSPVESGRVLLAARADPAGALHLAGLSPALAHAGGYIACAVAALAVAYVWRRGGHEVRSAALAAAVPIAAPFLLFYDLVTVSLAACWLVRLGRVRGFLPGEREGIAAALAADLLAAHPIVAATHLPFGAFPGPILLCLAVRRCRQPVHP